MSTIYHQDSKAILNMLLLALLLCLSRGLCSAVDCTRLTIVMSAVLVYLFYPTSNLSCMCDDIKVLFLNFRLN